MVLQRRDDPGGAPAFDPAKRYVRLTQVRADGFVEFEFAIGDPDLAVDLILPADAYRDFCRDNHAVLVSPLQGTAIDRARQRWFTNDHGARAEQPPLLCERPPKETPHVG